VGLEFQTFRVLFSTQERMDSGVTTSGLRFFLFYISPLILQKYMVRKKILENYTSSVVGDSGREHMKNLQNRTRAVQPATAVGHDGRGSVCFKNL
jgi:hypothetical protein